MQVKVVIPIYKAKLTPTEQVSLDRAFQILSHHPLCIVKPQSLDIAPLLESHPSLTVESFDDAYFGGIKSYNCLMLSQEFYERFSDVEYILIYQLDAYVFRDELSAWCSKGYDYIGAPWIKRKRYDSPVIKAYMSIFRKIDVLRGKSNRQFLYNQVGNGGFSLRKVASHLKVTQLYRDEIRFFTDQKQHHLYNEDVFWATQVNAAGKVKFVYPDYREALRFAFDTNPAYCYAMNNKTLPFGCHAWSKKRMIGFWSAFIPTNE